MYTGWKFYFYDRISATESGSFTDLEIKRRKWACTNYVWQYYSTVNTVHLNRVRSVNRKTVAVKCFNSYSVSNINYSSSNVGFCWHLNQCNGYSSISCSCNCIRSNVCRLLLSWVLTEVLLKWHTATQARPTRTSHFSPTQPRPIHHLLL